MTEKPRGDLIYLVTTMIVMMLDTDEMMIDTEEMAIDTDEMMLEPDEMIMSTDEMMIDTKEMTIDTDEMMLDIEEMIGGGEVHPLRMIRGKLKENNLYPCAGRLKGECLTNLKIC